jgi:UDP-N-acetyl-D-mannosaminuronic acid dehydrogenase
MVKIFIIGGLGHVGLTLGAVLSKRHHVFLCDINEEARTKFAYEKKASFFEPQLNELIVKNESRLTLSNSYDDIELCDYVIITIGTPIDEYLNPVFKNLFTLFDRLSYYVKDQTIILRSTVYPGMTKKLEKKHKNMRIAFCPERVAGGLMIEELQCIPQIVSANNEDTLNKASNLFTSMKIKVKKLRNTTEGELSKLMINSYRYIEFAISNNFFMMSQDAGCDFYSIYDAIVDGYPRMEHFKKPGFAAGYCLRKDSIQLASWQNNATFGFAYDASLVNENVPLWVFRQMRKKYRPLDKKTVGLLGLTFKGNTDDTRDSLSFRMKKILENEVKQVLVHDPFVSISESVTLDKLLTDSDIIILMALHDEYKQLNIKKPIIDIWNWYGKGVGL